MALQGCRDEARVNFFSLKYSDALVAVCRGRLRELRGCLGPRVTDGLGCLAWHGDVSHIAWARGPHSCPDTILISLPRAVPTPVIVARSHSALSNTRDWRKLRTLLCFAASETLHPNFAPPNQDPVVEHF